MGKKGFFSAKRITGLAVLLALVIVLQVALGQVKIGATSFSLVLIPIVLGGILYGPIAGGLLGFVFGFIVLMYGVTGADPFTAIMFNDHPFWTSVICIGKGTAAGLVAGVLYKVVAKKNVYAATFVAAAVAPMVNTGLFIVGALCFLQDTITTNFLTSGSTMIYFLFIGCAGINFLIEFAVNLIASPSIYRVINIIEGKRPRKKSEEQTNKDEKTEI